MSLERFFVKSPKILRENQCDAELKKEATQEMDISEKENVIEEIILDANNDERAPSDKLSDGDDDASEDGDENQESTSVSSRPASTSSAPNNNLSFESVPGCSEQDEATTPKVARRCRVVARPPASGGTTKKEMKRLEAERRKLEQQRAKEELEKKKAAEKALKEEQRQQAIREREEKKRIEEEEKERKKQEREREIERKRQEAELDRQRKERERQEKEEKKRLELEQKQKEKEEKDRLKEEERRQKQLEAEQKQKEKDERDRQKEDERRQKQAEDEEKIRKLERQKNMMINYFNVKPLQKQATEKPTSDAIGFKILPFQLKENMILAPVIRRGKLNPTESDVLNNLIKEQDYEKDQLYLPLLLKKWYKPSTSGRTIFKNGSVADVVVIDESNTSLPRMKVKMLQFHENVRPPYYGTWRKSSLKVGARRPFAKETKLLDYDADSDDEWEDQEGEVDECVSGDEDVEDEEDQAENDDEDDGFFVDHGHLSDDELQKEEEEEDEENLDPEERQVRMRIKAKLWKDEQDAKKKGMVPLKPLVIGPIWQKAENCDAADRNLLQKLLEFEAILVDVQVIPTAGTSKLNDYIDFVNEELSALRPPRTPKGANFARKAQFPDEAIPDLIRMVHGSSRGLQFLVREFQIFWQKKQLPDVSLPDGIEFVDRRLADFGSFEFLLPKSRIEQKIKEIANYSQSRWIVKAEILSKFGLTDFETSGSAWEWQVKKTPKPPKTPVSPSTGTAAKSAPSPQMAAKSPPNDGADLDATPAGATSTPLTGKKRPLNELRQAQLSFAAPRAKQAKISPSASPHGPTISNGPAVCNGPAVGLGPAINNGPAVGLGPTISNGPAVCNGPAISNGPALCLGPAISNGSVVAPLLGSTDPTKSDHRDDCVQLE